MSHEEFTKRFKQRVEHADHITVIRALKISRPTFYRWMNGESAPHPIGRESVFIALDGVGL